MRKIAIILTAVVLMFIASISAQTTRKTTSGRGSQVTVNSNIGRISDASMHHIRLSIYAIRQHSIDISIDDNTNMSKAYIMEGNTAKVTYRKTKQGNVATKIEGCPDYYFAIGKWTREDPISPKKRMGVELSINGEASSINMATLPYTHWIMQGEPGKLIIFGKSIGNGQTEYVETVVTISKKRGKWIMTDEDNNEIYTKEE